MAIEKGTPYQFDLPAVTNVSIAPNPVQTGGGVVVTAKATIQKTTLYAETSYSGEIYESVV